MSDQETSVAELREIVKRFVAERQWQKFHAPKNISMALAIEAAELMEHFQWISVPQSKRSALNEQQLREIGEEIADVLCYVMALANELDLDLSEIMRLWKLFPGRSSLE